MAALGLGRSAASLKRMMARPFSTKPLPLPMYKEMVDKVQQIKPACASLKDVSKSVQVLETNLKEYHLIWKVNHRRLLHEGKPNEVFARRNYRFAVAATAAAMCIVTRAVNFFN